MREQHELRHARMTDGSWTPACTCGWYSPKKSHSDFERHRRRFTTPENVECQLFTSTPASGSLCSTCRKPKDTHPTPDNVECPDCTPENVEAGQI